MYISACSADFPDDESHVVFVLSYLSDAPLDMFRADIIHTTSIGTLPTWFTSYSEFSTCLTYSFSLVLLTQRQMPCSLSSPSATVIPPEPPAILSISTTMLLHTGWNDQALSRLYYKGLPGTPQGQTFPSRATFWPSCASRSCSPSRSALLGTSPRDLP
jgi:hypothetical protein